MQQGFIHLHKIAGQNLCNADIAHHIIRQADTAGNSPGQVLPAACGTAKIDDPLNKPGPQRRCHAAHSSKAGAYHAAQPGAAVPAGPTVDKRGFTQDQKGGNKLKPAHAAHHAGGEHQQVTPPGRFAAPPGNGTEQQPRQSGQQPGPQAPVQIFHAALRPGGKHHGAQPRQRRKRPPRPPYGQADQQSSRIEQHTVDVVQYDFPRFAAVLKNREHFVQHAERPALQPGLVGVSLKILRGNGGVVPVPVAVLFITPVLGIYPHKAAGAGLVLLHLQHAAEHESLGAIVPKAGQIGAAVVPPNGQNNRQHHNHHRRYSHLHRRRQGSKFLLQNNKFLTYRINIV